MEQKSSLKVKVQKLGTALSNMVMPNIGAFIAWGVLTALFIPTGWLPNAEFAKAVGPAITYLLPLLIGYTGGYVVHGQRGAVVGAIATFGAVAGSEVPMFIGAMAMGPLGGWAIKKFDQAFQEKIRPGFEMLVNNFSAGLIGFGLLLLAFKLVGPFVAIFTTAIGNGVQAIVDMKLLPLANILIEPAKILFLNNALNHGIFTPLGAEQVAKTGKSILFLLEANPGPGFGILLAYMVFGKGAAKSSSWGALIIHFLGGIHEIYFPYVMMKPALFLAVIGGGVTGTFFNQLLGSGLGGPASPGSIIAILSMVPKGGSYLAVLTGVFSAALVSFLIASIILKADKSVDDESALAEAQAATQAAKAESKGQTLSSQASAQFSSDDIQQIIFACDAGMGSSAMGASILRDKVKKAGLSIPVTNKAISNLTDVTNTLIVTQQELAPRAAQKTPRAVHVSVDNFLATPKYDEIVAQLAKKSSAELAKDFEQASAKEDVVDLNYIDEVVFAYGENKGSATMGQATLVEIFKNRDVGIPVSKVENHQLVAFNSKNILVVTNIANQSVAQQFAPQAQLLVVDSLVTTPEYDKMIDRMHK
ncbi:PTS mannitol transporter subunit IIB [Streptococcus pyogenes JRS4]|uniref:PTS mannitol-specific transporter subunit IIBC n=1 Tax=Streptococcus pyogenes TaxID=1314 RepID=UPI00004022A3|nr:PTS mannitol-specific transporter subunit IIBC [Streptococcus pyogenes]HER4563930.1 PTS mannitol transporter subunit IICBA [Streptococcus pyogenes NGAS639]HER4585042.1 PTS mannitol transporter subunit IICBA [Streptococcus pyogenes NGAS618]HER4612161.1 PTS mannitol transporter subunit IICBA [Streptococcus pyogenes NGAS603]HER4697934.1 PTS mannitol transporter subunit IICBA [Streptococcus pyogenes NGAS339]HER4709454.1 PTS mannitol transporter subunit IICBA [Streptococcus pyogenes NGAS321]HER